MSELDLLYAELPHLDCQGLCAEACGPILMTRLEEARIVERGGKTGWNDDLVCLALKDERCTVYPVRPAICRLWGLVESMPCMWGCKPDHYLTDAEGAAFLGRVAAVTA